MGWPPGHGLTRRPQRSPVQRTVSAPGSGGRWQFPSGHAHAAGPASVLSICVRIAHLAPRFGVVSSVLTQQCSLAYASECVRTQFCFCCDSFLKCPRMKRVLADSHCCRVLLACTVSPCTGGPSCRLLALPAPSSLGDPAPLSLRGTVARSRQSLGREGAPGAETLPLQTGEASQGPALSEAPQASVGPVCCHMDDQVDHQAIPSGGACGLLQCG